MPWLSIGWFSVLLVICYAPVLYSLIRQWNNDEDMGHGFFVPITAGYIAWQNRDKLFARHFTPNYWGLAVLGFAALQLYIATLGAELFLARTAFIESIIGVVLFLGGFEALRLLAFPIFLLFFMVPIPAVIYNQITFPLQIFASQVAEFALGLLGIPVLRDGNILELASQRLSVVEACSGIRSLLTLSFLSLVYAYFFDSKVWMRAVLLIATVPIAIIANAGRVTVTGILSEYNREWAHGLLHTMSGWVIFMIALGMLVITHQLINWVYKRAHGKAA
ncbi:MAG: exosortase/archaeosortase family protein [Bryobacteraceae bacterium]